MPCSTQTCSTRPGGTWAWLPGMIESLLLGRVWGQVQTSLPTSRSQPARNERRPRPQCPHRDASLLPRQSNALGNESGASARGQGTFQECRSCGPFARTGSSSEQMSICQRGILINSDSAAKVWKANRPPSETVARRSRRAPITTRRVAPSPICFARSSSPALTSRPTPHLILVLHQRVRICEPTANDKHFYKRRTRRRTRPSRRGRTCPTLETCLFLLP